MSSWERAWPEPETGASCISCWSSSPLTNTSTEPSSVVLFCEFFHQLGCPGSHYRMCHGSASTKLKRLSCLTVVMINPTRCALSIVENFKFQNLFIFPPKKWLKNLYFYTVQLLLGLQVSGVSSSPGIYLSSLNGCQEKLHHYSGVSCPFH